MTPPYVPPHLQGKVSDFEQDGAGTISFSHPEVATGGLGRDGARRAITQDQYKQTFDRDYRLKNWDKSIENQYGLPASPTNRAEEFKKWLAEKAQSGFDWGTSSQGKAVGTAGLLSALAGGAVGAWRGHQNGTPVSSGLLYALAAGTAGAGITALTQGQHNKREAFLKQASSSIDIIIQALENDNSMSSSQKADCLRALSKVSDAEMSDLSALLRTAAGAGGGMLIAKFLGAKGLIPFAAAGILGSMFGSPDRPGKKYNHMGQLSLSNYQ